MDGKYERCYHRFGARYIDAIMAAIWVWVQVVIVPLYVGLLLIAWPPTITELARCVLAYEIAFGLVAGPGSFMLARRLAPAAYRWTAGQRSAADAPAAWAALVSGLPRWILVEGAWYALCSLPPTIYVGTVMHFRWYGYLIYLISLGTLILVFLALVYLFTEQALRPIVRETASHLPRDCEVPRGVMTLSVKALVLIPAINFFSAVVVGLVGKSTLDPELYLGHVVVLALAMSLTLSLGLTLLFRNSLLRRVEELAGAMRSVDEDDLDVYVAPLAGDELDDMGASFNDMVGGLREREVLREHNAQLIVDLLQQAAELRVSRARIVAASDSARRDVERDLHDGAQQRLLLLGLKLAMARRNVQDDPAVTAAQLDDLQQELACAVAELRDLAHGIYPAVLENEGLPAALHDAIGRAAITCQLHCDTTARYPGDIEAAVYFCCLEALQNAAKHAGPDATAHLYLTDADGQLTFCVRDDGPGFDATAAGRSGGLQNMGDRLGALGGSLNVTSTAAYGTTITGTIALSAPPAEHHDSSTATAQRPAS
jgi:signal transduction histidine kinase